MNNRAKKRNAIIFVLIFIILRTFFALVWDVGAARARNNCPPYSNSVFQFTGTINHNSALCEKDEDYASLGLEPNSYLILDMETGNEIVDGPGVDFYYYERPLTPGIQLDKVEVAVAQDDGTGNPADFKIVFIWGDENSDNNGAILSSYLPEDPNKPISTADLYNNTGIGINIGNDDGALYRFIRFQTHPLDAAPANDERAEVDAVEGIHPPPTSSPTPLPVVTPSLTATSTPSETPFEISTYTATQTIVSETPLLETITSTLTTTNTLTPTSSITASTPTLPSSSTATSSDTSTPAPTVTPTETIKPTQKPASTHTPTNTLELATFNIDPTPTEEGTFTPTTLSKTSSPTSPAANHIPSNTSTSNNTPTSSITYTKDVTKNATATFTQKSTPTEVATGTKITLELITPVYTSIPVITTTPPPPPDSNTPNLGPSRYEGIGISLTVASLILAGFTGILPEDQKRRLWKLFITNNTRKIKSILTGNSNRKKNIEKNINSKESSRKRKRK